MSTCSNEFKKGQKVSLSGLWEKSQKSVEAYIPCLLSKLGANPTLSNNPAVVNTVANYFNCLVPEEYGNIENMLDSREEEFVNGLIKNGIIGKDGIIVLFDMDGLSNITYRTDRGRIIEKRHESHLTKYTRLNGNGLPMKIVIENEGRLKRSSRAPYVAEYTNEKCTKYVIVNIENLKYISCCDGKLFDTEEEAIDYYEANKEGLFEQVNTNNTNNKYMRGQIEKGKRELTIEGTEKQGVK